VIVVVVVKTSLIFGCQAAVADWWAAVNRMRRNGSPKHLRINHFFALNAVQSVRVREAPAAEHPNVID
jgi:hypothetical protein